jgi:hypothetical protein
LYAGQSLHPRYCTFAARVFDCLLGIETGEQWLRFGCWCALMGIHCRWPARQMYITASQDVGDVISTGCNLGLGAR